MRALRSVSCPPSTPRSRSRRPGLTSRDLLYYSGIVDLHRIYERVKCETELGDDVPDVHHCEVVDVLKRNGPCTELNKPEYCSKAC